MESPLAELDGGRHADILAQITSGIDNDVSALHVVADATAPFEVEIDQVDLVLDDFQFLRSGADYDFQIVNLGRSRLVAKVAITVTAPAEAGYSMTVWDSIDKDYVSLGGGSVERQVEFDSAVLITLSGGFTPMEDVEVEDAELVEAIRSVDLGYLEIERHEEYD